MSEEEKKAIEGLKKDLLIHECWEANNLDKIFKISHLHSLRVVLNLIEKQQKEIEELNKTLKCTQKSWYKDTQIIDKIKETLEKYKYTEIGDSEKIIEFYKKMQSLLEKE